MRIRELLAIVVTLLIAFTLIVQSLFNVDIFRESNALWALGLSCLGSVVFVKTVRELLNATRGVVVFEQSAKLMSNELGQLVISIPKAVSKGSVRLYLRSDIRRYEGIVSVEASRDRGQIEVASTSLKRRPAFRGFAVEPVTVNLSFRETPAQGLRLVVNLHRRGSKVIQEEILVVVKQQSSEGIEE